MVTIHPSVTIFLAFKAKLYVCNRLFRRELLLRKVSADDANNHLDTRQLDAIGAIPQLGNRTRPQIASASTFPCWERCNQVFTFHQTLALFYFYMDLQASVISFDTSQTNVDRASTPFWDACIALNEYF